MPLGVWHTSTTEWCVLSVLPPSSRTIILVRITQSLLIEATSPSRGDTLYSGVQGALFSDRVTLHRLPSGKRKPLIRINRCKTSVSIRVSFPSFFLPAFPGRSNPYTCSLLSRAWENWSSRSSRRATAIDVLSLVAFLALSLSPPFILSHCVYLYSGFTSTSSRLFSYSSFLFAILFTACPWSGNTGKAGRTREVRSKLDGEQTSLPWNRTSTWQLNQVRGRNRQSIQSGLDSQRSLLCFYRAVTSSREENLLLRVLFVFFPLSTFSALCLTLFFSCCSNLFKEEDRNERDGSFCLELAARRTRALGHVRAKGGLQKNKKKTSTAWSGSMLHSLSLLFREAWLSRNLWSCNRLLLFGATRFASLPYLLIYLLHTADVIRFGTEGHYSFKILILVG